ncbi:hypothetical protein BJ875DRAFT_527860, partial [Amylocarpus encephaloides]
QPFTATKHHQAQRPRSLYIVPLIDCFFTSINPFNQLIFQYLESISRSRHRPRFQVLASNISARMSKEFAKIVAGGSEDPLPSPSDPGPPSPASPPCPPTPPKLLIRRFNLSLAPAEKFELLEKLPNELVTKIYRYMAAFEPRSFSIIEMPVLSRVPVVGAAGLVIGWRYIYNPDFHNNLPGPTKLSRSSKLADLFLKDAGIYQCLLKSTINSMAIFFTPGIDSLAIDSRVAIAGLTPQLSLHQEFGHRMKYNNVTAIRIQLSTLDATPHWLLKNISALPYLQEIFIVGHRLDRPKIGEYFDLTIRFVHFSTVLTLDDCSREIMDEMIPSVKINGHTLFGVPAMVRIHQEILDQDEQQFLMSIWTIINEINEIVFRLPRITLNIDYQPGQFSS